MEKDVCKKKRDLAKKSGIFFISLTLEDFSARILGSSLYDQGTPERSKWVQEAGKIFLAQISEKRCEAPRQKKYHYARRKKHVKKQKTHLT